LDLPLATVGFGHSGVDNLDHDRSDVETGAITLDVGNDRLIGHGKREIGIDADLFADGRNLDVLVHEAQSPATGLKTLETWPA
jgi:hypothetical protein